MTEYVKLQRVSPYDGRLRIRAAKVTHRTERRIRVVLDRLTITFDLGTGEPVNKRLPWRLRKGTK